MQWRLLIGDVREKLAELPASSVQCCVTSPPYWGLRDYGHAGQIGLENSASEFVETMRDVFREVRRVLMPDGLLWLNIGDSYAGGGNYRGITSENTLAPKQASNRGARGTSQSLGALGKDAGVASKNLVGIPWRVAFALQNDGWHLRSDIIWAKPNPMPESVTDRPTKAHEYVFLLAKSQRYYYNADAIRERGAQRERFGNTGPKQALNMDRQDGGKRDLTIIEFPNCRTVWTFATQPYPDAHFATFPEELPTRCILAGSKPGDTVLDPFCGSGTTGQVALALGRNFVGIELNPSYAELARKRIGGSAPLFASEQTA